MENIENKKNLFIDLKQYTIKNINNINKLYIYDDLLNQDFFIGIIFEKIIIKENYYYTHREIINNFGIKNIKLKRPEKFIQIVLHKMNFYPHSIASKKSYYKHETLLDNHIDNKRYRADIIGTDSKNKCFSIIEIKDIKNKTKEHISNQINNYLKTLAKNYELSDTIKTIELIINVDYYFFDLFNLNNLKKDLQMNNFLKIYSLEKILKKNKRNEYKIIEETKISILNIIKYDKKIIEKRIGTYSNKETITLRIHPKNLVLINKDLNPRDLNIQISLRILIKILTCLNYEYNPLDDFNISNKNKYDIDQYTNNKILQILDTPLYIENENEKIMVGNFSLSDGQRSTVAIYLLYLLFNMSKIDISKNENELLNNVIEKLSFWKNFKGQKDLNNFYNRFILPLINNKCIFDTDFHLLVQLNETKNIKTAIRQAVAQQDRESVYEINNNKYIPIIHLFNKHLFKNKIQIKYPNYFIPKGFLTLEIDDFFKILHDVSNITYKNFTERAKNISFKKRDDLFKSFETTDINKCNLIDEQNQLLEKTNIIINGYNKQIFNKNEKIKLIDKFNQLLEKDITKLLNYTQDDNLFSFNNLLNKIKENELELSLFDIYDTNIEKKSKFKQYLQILKDFNKFNLQYYCENKNEYNPDTIIFIKFIRLLKQRKINYDKVFKIIKIHLNLPYMILSIRNIEEVQKILNLEFSDIYSNILIDLYNKNILNNLIFLENEFKKLLEYKYNIYSNYKYFSKQIKDQTFEYEENKIKNKKWKTNNLFFYKCKKCKNDIKVDLTEKEPSFGCTCH